MDEHSILTGGINKHLCEQYAVKSARMWRLTFTSGDVMV